MIELGVLDRAPVYAMAHVDNPLALAATLTGVRAMVERVAPGLVQWGPGGAHRDVPIVSIRGRIQSRDDAPTVTIHYAIVKDVLAVSPDRWTLHRLVDHIIDGAAPTTHVGRSEGAPKPPTGRSTTHVGRSGGLESMQSIVSLDLGKKSGWLAHTVLGLLEQEVHRQHSAAYRDLDLLRRGLGGTLPDGAERRRLAMAYLGYEPMAIQGGPLTVDAAGRITHAAYGTRAEPIVQQIPVKGAYLTRLVSSLRRVSGRVAFEGEGSSRALHVSGEWVPR